MKLPGSIHYENRRILNRLNEIYTGKKTAMATDNETLQRVDSKQSIRSNRPNSVSREQLYQGFKDPTVNLLNP